MTRTRLSSLAVVAALLTAAPRGRSEEARVVRVVAKRFTYTPSEVRLKKGEAVVLELVSEDRVHGFNLPAFKIRADIAPKETVRIPLTPDRTGTFTFACDVFCGEGHDDMSGTIVVTD